MVKIKIDEQVFSICTELNEITLEKFAELSKIASKKYEFKLDGDIDSIIILSDGLTLELFDKIKMNDVSKIISATQSINYSNVEMRKEFLFNGTIYKTSFDGFNEFDFTTKEFALMQKALKEDQINNVKDFAGILFREEGGDLSAESIQRRSELFYKNMTMDIIYPYIELFQKKAVDYYAN